MMNPLSPATPATLPHGTNMARFYTYDPTFPWDTEIQHGMGYTRIDNARKHLRRDGLSSLNLPAGTCDEDGFPIR